MIEHQTEPTELQKTPKLRYKGVIFHLLRQGYHFSSQDNLGEHPGMYKELSFNIEYYRAYFKELNYVLLEEHGVYFFEQQRSTGLGAKSKQFTFFMSVLINDIASNSLDPQSEIFNSPFPIEELPHLRAEEYKAGLNLFKIQNIEDLIRLVKRMQACGFLELQNDTIRFKKPIRRYLEMFTKISELVE